MQFFLTGIYVLSLGMLLSACSPVDSTKVFDQQQAANLLSQYHTMQPTQQMIKIALPEKTQWRKIDMSLGTVGTPIMLIPNNETPCNWNQSIRTQILAFKNAPEATLNKFVQNKIADAKQICRLADASILTQNNRYAIYRIDMCDCHDKKNQTQIGKVFAGNDAIYSLYYSAVTGQISNEQINKLSKTIKTAQLMRDPRFGLRS